MDNETRFERDTNVKVNFLDESEKLKYQEEIMELLHQYPENFFLGKFEHLVNQDLVSNRVVLGKQGEEVIGCLFFNDSSRECNWLAVSKNYLGNKGELAKKMFQTVFDSVPSGSVVFWYVNTEDSVYEGENIGKYYSPARKLYSDLGARFTRVENKFGEGNHSYLVEVEI
jgi:hypothetical protein